MNSWFHAVSAQKKWGGTPEEYYPIEVFIDSSRGDDLACHLGRPAEADRVRPTTKERELVPGTPLDGIPARFLKVDQVAEWLNISIRSVYALMHTGQLVSLKIGGCGASTRPW